MSDPNQSLKLLAEINTQLREAVLACFPCAYEQYVTIQIPGTIIDTRLGGSYLPRGEKATADVRNMIDCNEAMLVDSMIPLDKVMLGPTGKSVTRSYMTALDMLIPRKSDISSFNINSDLSGDGSSAYSQAMKFLRSKETILTPKSDIMGSRLLSAKGTLEAGGVSGTVVDRYVEKQIALSEARGKWDAVRSEALEVRELGGDAQQTAAKFSARQKDIKRVQGELHARWMDWVVNGDKYRVEYCFSVVDRDSIMARIEKGREATRDALLTAIDGTDWAKVTLEPSNWAQLCREKAIAWKTRNPTNPAQLQLRLESLKRMKQAYEVYNEQLASRSEPRKLTTTMADAQAAVAKAEAECQTEKTERGKETEKLKRLELTKASKKALVDALQKVEAAKKERDDAKIHSDAADGDVNSDAKLKLEKADERLAGAEEYAVKVESVGSIRQEQELELKLALVEIYNYETEERIASEADHAVQIDSDAKSKSTARVKNAKEKVEAAKVRWLNAKHALQATGTNDSVSSLEAGGISAMKIAISGHLKSLESDISTTQEQLFSTTAGLGDAPSTIIGVTDNKALIRTSGDTAEKPESATTASTEESADAWTKVAFSVGSTSSSSSTQESNISGSASLEVGRWWTSVKASTSFSSSSKKVESAMASCRVEGSFSAIVVNIKRPWLHGDLFQDFDIDISNDSKLSPGAEQIKTWVDKGDPGGIPAVGAEKRTDYGKFPAYPTAFIVAADTVLEFKSTTQNSVEMMSALSTDSSIQASYGPWGLKGGATAKTDNKDSSQKMDVKDGGLRIAFQAPQIIGWVSEILPQLPRGSNAAVRGGLTAPPLMAFRN